MSGYMYDVKKFISHQSFRLLKLMLFLSVLAFVVYSLYFDDGPYSVYDDSFISFRYARNLAQGYGPVFNPGERVEGYTNFLWTALMAIAIAVGTDVIVASKIAATAAGAATLWLTFRLGQQELGDRWSSVIAASMLALTAGFARYAVSGFEILLYGMLVLLGLYLYLRALRADTIPYAAGAVLALAAMTRPEGVMIYGVITLHYAIMLWLRPDPARERLAHVGGWLASFGMVYAPYFAWRYGYYGQLLPNTFYAKVGEPGMALFRRGLLYLRDMLLVNPQVAICIILGFFWRGQKSTQTLLYGLIGVYLMYILAIGGDDQAVFGPRFLIPMLPAIYILGISGLMGLTSRLDHRRQRLLRVGFIGALVCTFALWSGIERQGYLGLQNTMNRGWITLGRWLAVQAHPDATLAADAAGIIPFYTNLYTIDMFGLNDLHIAHLDVTTGQGLAGHEKSDPAYVLNRRPTYIVGWLDQDGQALYFHSGIPKIADQLEDDYVLWAIVLMRLPVGDEAPIVVNPVYTIDLYEKGYIYGVFRRKNEADVR